MRESGAFGHLNPYLRDRRNDRTGFRQRDMNEPNIERAKARACLEGRLADMKRALEAETDEEGREDGATGEDILAMRRRDCYDLQLSWGGPSDWLRVFVEDGKPGEVEYHYADWGTHEEVALTPREERILRDWISRFLPLEE